jgi:glutamine synthetase
MTEVELHARNEVKWEQYAKMIQIESRVLEDMSKNHILPVATRYQTSLLENVTMMKEVYPTRFEALSADDMEIIEKIAYHTSQIKHGVYDMVEARKAANVLTHERDKAIAYHDTVAPFLDSIRYHIDKLELIVDNQIWPLPKYRELLFIR